MSHFQLRPEEEGCKGIFWEGGEGGGDWAQLELTDA